MKKFLSLLLSLLLCIFILPLSGCNNSSSPIAKPPSKFTIPFNKLNVDWDKAIEETIKKVNIAANNDDELIFSLSNADIDVSDNDITCNITINSYDNSYFALHTMNYILRVLNSSAKEQDDRIVDYDDNTYGGIYDIADLQVKMYGKNGDVFIDDHLSAGEHRQRGLHCTGDMLSVDWSRVGNTVRQLYSSNYDKNIFAAQFMFFAKDFDKKEDANSVCLMLVVKKGLGNQDLKSTTLEFMSTVNQICQRQDPSIVDFSTSSYGGIYNDNNLLLLVMESEDGNLGYDDEMPDITRYCMLLEPGKYEDLDNHTAYNETAKDILKDWMF